VLQIVGLAELVDIMNEEGIVTDKEYNKLLLKLSKANDKYKNLLFLAEEEFKNRYGSYPSDIDFDYWIDTYHIGTGLLTSDQIENEFSKNFRYK